MSGANDSADALESLLSNLRIPTARDENSNNSRIHVKLNMIGRDVTRIMIRRHWGGEEIVKRTLGLLWTSFGTVSNVFYDDDFTYCFLSFPNHESAASALTDINDKKRVIKAIRGLVEKKKGDPGVCKITEQITCHLVLNDVFMTDPRASMTDPRASWARPQRPRHGYDDDAYGESYSCDDCPDGIDRDEWNSYCEGRD